MYLYQQRLPGVVLKAALQLYTWYIPMFCTSRQHYLNLLLSPSRCLPDVSLLKLYELLTAELSEPLVHPPTFLSNTSYSFWYEKQIFLKQNWQVLQLYFLLPLCGLKIRHFSETMMQPLVFLHANYHFMLLIDWAAFCAEKIKKWNKIAIDISRKKHDNSINFNSVCLYSVKSRQVTTEVVSGKRQSRNQSARRPCPAE